jgi:Glycosyl hydrolases family 18
MGTRAMHRRRAAGGRASVLRAVAVAAVIGGVATGCSSDGGGSNKAHGGGTAVPFAPYVDTSLSPAYSLTGTAGKTGVKEFNLAFVTAASGGGCTPRWAGAIALGDDRVASQIDALRAKGGNVRVSFGGFTGTELAGACSSVSDLADAYGSVVDAYRLNAIDFDIEGDAVSDTDADTRRAQAVAQLQKDHPKLKVSLTLPVATSGLNGDALALLKNAKDNGVRIDKVNIMTMDYGSSQSGDMAGYAMASATAVQKQLMSTLGLAAGAAWHTLSVTPMIGVNDVRTETFTTNDARRIVDFARSKGLGGLSLWSGNRDRECPGGTKKSTDPTCSSVDQQPLAFTRAFAEAAH